jgi:hypothetical protein
MFSGRRQNCLFNPLENDIGIDGLIAVNCVDNSEDFITVHDWVLVVLCVVKKKAGAMSHFSKSTEDLCRKPFRSPVALPPCGERNWKSEKWSKTYILPISGPSNAVLVQTNSKLPQKSTASVGKSSAPALLS